MHPSTNIDDIKKELNNLGHTVMNIWNIKQNRTKKPLPIFVELKPDSNNKKIYEINILLQCRIKFKPPQHKREIPQCANC